MSDHTPPVSILVAAFNAGKFIGEALESFLSQTYTDFEMIISDNASQDDTEAICRRFAERDQRVRYVRNPVNLGSNGNFLNLLALSRGRYLLMAADHDLWRPDFLERYMAEFEKHSDCILVYSPATVISAAGDVLSINQPDTPKDVGKYSTFYNVLAGTIRSEAICGVIRKDALLKTSFHTTLGPDTLTLAELSLYGSFCQLPQSYYYRRQNRPPESIQESAKRYISMLFTDPPEIIKDMPYVYMVYKALCMVQNNHLAPEDQKLLNLYILYVFFHSWGVTADHLVYLLIYLKDHPQKSADQNSTAPQPAANRLKPEQMDLDTDLFFRTIRDSAYSEIEKKYAGRIQASPSSTKPLKKWPTPMQYDICYLLYNVEKWGGVKGTIAQANGLVDRGYRVCIVCRTDKPGWIDIRTDYIVSPDLSANDIPESDIVIGTWYPTVAAGFLAQKGLCVHYCRGYEAQAPDLSATQKSEIEKVYQLPTIKIANSSHVGKFLEDHFPGHVYVVRNDIDHAIFYPARKREWGGPPLKILVVGPYQIPWKGIRDCLEACKLLCQIPDLPVSVVRASQTVLNPDEEELVESMACPVEYHFNLSETQMASLYNQCDVMISGSYPYVESFGRPAMEALACGLPVVLTDIPAYKDFDTEHDFALFVPPGDSRSMAEAISKIAQNPELRSRLIRRGFEVSSKYSLGQTMGDLDEALQNIYHEILHGKDDISDRNQYYAYARPEVQAMIRPEATKILDVGCAAGQMASELKSRLKAEVWGVEVVENAANQARAKLDRVIAKTVEEALPDLPDYYFDAVVLADVLEHLQNPYAILEGLRSKLTVNGEIIASIPNVRHWSVLKDLLEGKWEYRDAGILDRTHLRFFTKSGMAELFAGAGFEIAEMKATSIAGAEVPPDVLRALASTTLDISTLPEEGAHYQYLVRARIRRDVNDVVSIIILTFNQLEYTKKCIESIRKHTPEPHEIIFVDNGSSDGTVQWLRAQIRDNPHYKLLENPKNLGFARGCNQGMAMASGNYLLLLNNDVVVAEGWLSGLMDCLKTAPDAGIVGPLTNSISGPQQVCDPSYRSVDDLDACAAAFRNRYRHRRLPFARIVGFCILFKRTLVEQIGGLDESFGTGNFEDDDFCLRAMLEGHQNYIAGDVFIHHFRSISFKGNRIDYGTTISGNRSLLAKKWTIKAATPQGRMLAVLKAEEQAEKLYFRGETDKAVEALVDAIKVAPDAGRIYALMARIFIEAKRFDEAWAVLEAMPEAARGGLAALELAGYVREGQGRDDEAGTYARRMLSISQSHAAALNLEGVLSFKKGDKPLARKYFEKAIAADPGYGEAYTNLGVLCWGLEQKEEALRHMQQGFNLCPTSQDAASLYYSVVTAMNRFDDAETDFYAATNLYTGHRNLIFLYIDLLIRQEKFTPAMPAIEDALEKFGAGDDALAAALSIREKIGLRQIDKKAGRASLSLCMIVRNEETNLLKCLRSVRDVVDEMIIVDTGSTDKTKDIARVFGAEIFDFAWTGDFSAARNFSLAQAQGDWILVVDADEAVSELDHPALRLLIGKGAPSPAAYSIVTRNYILNESVIGWTPNDGRYPEQPDYGWMESAKVRLFPRAKKIFFTNPVHEVVEASLAQAGIPVFNCNVIVHHYGKLDRDREARKDQEYYLLGKAKYENNPGDVKSINELARQAHLIGKYEEAKNLWLKLLGILEADPHAPGFAEIARVTEGDPLSDIRTQLAAAYLGLNQFDEALAEARKAMSAPQKPAGEVYVHAVAEIIAGSPDNALKELEGVLEKNPSYAPGLYLKAVINCLKGERETAGKLFLTLRQKQFDLLTPRINHLIGQLRVFGKTAEAMRLAVAAIESNISDEETVRLYTALQSEPPGWKTGQ